MTRDIDQRIADVATIKEVRKQQALQTVLRAGSLRLAAKTLATTQDELRVTLINYGVKHEPFQTWHSAVKEYIDAGQPYQYEMNFDEEATQFIDRFLGEEGAPRKERYWLDSDLHPPKVEWYPWIGFDLASTDRLGKNYTIECEQEIKSKYDPLP